ncbi:MAG: bifunctional UDP-N-acetylglucosamine diphosphorylase/glucosamine-1-phosphate N-acetyltransferase GlmU [Actinomycetia bacterium]|nr:bifunctional UDP-N-acetylglucosamine diphosphorylase/glucosamine-1-phosphate N-acetyltransferase GlmU [Actinomycetes bacterium]
MSHVVIIMAAGEGVRMRSEVPKVLHPVAGRPILSWIVNAAAATGPERIMVVVGAGARRVRSILPPGVETCHQPQRRGTGQAALVGMEALGELADHTPVVVLPGDVPLITSEAISRALEMHVSEGAAATMLTAEVEDPTGYGRVLRDSQGWVEGVVEHVDATVEQREVREINTSLYVFAAGPLRAALGRIGAGNRQGEYYLPDVIGLMVGDAMPVTAMPMPVHNALGVNDQAQLAEVAGWMRRRILRRHMLAGVWMEDPDRTYVDADVELSPGVRLHAGVHLEGKVVVGEGAIVGPDTYVRNSSIGPGSRVWYAVVRESRIGADVQVGPYASLRPGTRIDGGGKAGSFVEIKNSRLREGAKAPHLSYVGDADVGERANIGAGTITANYDGYRKHRTVIGPGAQIGSNTVLVAPVEVGEEGWTGAGSTITRPVPSGALAVERSSQKSLPGYAARRAARYREENETSDLG